MEAIDKRQPYFIYRRITLNAGTEYFLEKIEQGFYYLLREIVVAYPELDVAGVNFGPELSFEMVQRAQDIFPQDEPIPFRHVSTPGNDGIQVTAGLQLTATPVKANKILNVIYPEKDNIEIKITGQNGTNPVFIDIMLNGYLIPVNE
jgi:hypothetical protein